MIEIIKKALFLFCDFDPFVLHVRECEGKALASVDGKASRVRLNGQRKTNP